jgi:hypothetical protein
VRNGLVTVGSALLVGGLFLSLREHSRIWYTPFVVGGFLLLETVNGSNRFSVLKHTQYFLKLWLIFLGMTIAIETVGDQWLNLWFYPRLSGLAYVFHVLIIGYPFTGFFALELFVWLQSVPFVRRTQFVFLPVAAFIFAYVNEYPNTFAYEWRYGNWPLGEVLNIPILVPFLWVSLLFVVLFKPWFTI